MASPADNAEQILDQITDALTTDQALKLAEAYAALAQSDAILTLADALTQHGAALTHAAQQGFTKLIPKLITPTDLEQTQPQQKGGYHVIENHTQITERSRLRPSDIVPLVDSLKSGNTISATGEELEWIRSYLSPQERIRLLQSYQQQTENFSVWLSVHQQYQAAEQPQDSDTSSQDAQATYESHAFEQRPEDQEYQQDYEERYVVHPLDESIPVEPEAPSSTQTPDTPRNVRVKNQQRPQNAANGATAPVALPQADKCYPPATARALNPRHVYDAVTDLLNGKSITTRSTQQLSAIKQALPPGHKMLTQDGEFEGKPAEVSFLTTLPSASTLAALEAELGLPPGVIRDPDPETDEITETDPGDPA